MPADVVAFRPAGAPDLRFVRVRGEGRLVHVATLSMYEKHVAARIDMPRCTSKLITRCTRRLSEPALTTEAVTCGHCAPDAKRSAYLDATLDVIVGAIA